MRRGPRRVAVLRVVDQQMAVAASDVAVSYWDVTVGAVVEPVELPRKQCLGGEWGKRAVRMTATLVAIFHMATTRADLTGHRGPP